MKRLVSIFLVLSFLAVFVVACAGVSRDAQIKCPKCGAVFTVDEGLRSQEKVGGEKMK